MSIVLQVGEEKQKNCKMATCKVRLYASLNPKCYVDHETGSKAQDGVNLGEGTCNIRHATREEVN
jgi:hypothetical protein